MSDHSAYSDKDLAKIASDLFLTLARCSEDVSRSPIDRVLRKKLGPFGACGTYIIRSFELLVKEGRSPAEVLEHHKKMVDMIQILVMETLEKKDAQSSVHLAH